MKLKWTLCYGVLLSSTIALSAPASAQVTSVSQLRDVFPTDSASQASKTRQTTGGDRPSEHSQDGAALREGGSMSAARQNASNSDLGTLDPKPSGGKQ